MKRFRVGSMIVVCACFSIGNSAAAQQTTLADSPAVSTSGAPRELFLSVSNGEWDELQERATTRPRQKNEPVLSTPRVKHPYQQKVLVVNVKNDSGKMLARRVVPVYAGDIIADTMKQELTAAGYRVNVVRRLPKNVASGVDISRISAELEENSGLLTVAGTCNLRIDADFWRNGVRVKSQNYASTVSDYSFSDQDQFFVDLIDASARNIMKQAEPDITRN